MKVSNLNSYMIGKKLSPFQSDLSAAFFRLEGDTIEYRATDFRSRFRCFSAYKIQDSGIVRDDDQLSKFNLTKDFHTQLSNNEVRQPDERLVESKAIEALLAEMVSSMPVRRQQDYAFGVNLVRVIASDTHIGSPAPSLHQDGYNPFKRTARHITYSNGWLQISLSRKNNPNYKQNPCFFNI